MVKLPAPDIFPDAVKQKSLTDIKVPCPCILVPRSKGASIKGWTTQEQTRLCVEGLPSYNLYYWNALTSQFSKAVFVCYGVFELSSGIGTKIVSRQGSTFVVHYLVIRPTEFDLRKDTHISKLKAVKFDGCVEKDNYVEDFNKARLSMTALALFLKGDESWLSVVNAMLNASASSVPKDNNLFDPKDSNDDGDEMGEVDFGGLEADVESDEGGEGSTPQNKKSKVTPKDSGNQKIRVKKVKPTAAKKDKIESQEEVKVRGKKDPAEVLYEENLKKIREMKEEAKEKFFLFEEGVHGRNKLEISVPLTWLKQFPLKADEVNGGDLHRFRTRPLVKHRLQVLKAAKLRDLDIGSYSAAPIVNPFVTDVSQLKLLISKMKRGDVPKEEEKFYLIGNNHNHQSSLEVIEHIRQNNMGEDKAKRFTSLKCQPMVMPNGVHNGFDFDDFNNKATIIRALGNDHNADARSVCVTQDIEAVIQCFQHCLSYLDPSLRGSPEIFLDEIRKANTREMGGQKTSLRVCVEACFLDVFLSRRSKDGKEIKVYPLQNGWNNLFFREDFARPEGLELVKLLIEFLEAYMELQLPGQGAAYKQYLLLKAANKLEEAETYRRAQGNFSVAAKFANFNTINFHTKLLVLRRILRKPGVTYEENCAQKDYTLKEFWDDIADAHFNNTFQSRWETVLVIPGPDNIGRVEIETPTLYSCLDVLKIKRVGGPGRPPKEEKINHCINYQRLYALAAGYDNQELPEDEKIQLGTKYFNEGLDYRSFFSQIKFVFKKNVPKPETFVKRHELWEFNLKLEKRMTVSAGLEADMFYREQLKDIQIDKCNKGFSNTFKIPIIKHFRMLPKALPKNKVVKEGDGHEGHSGIRTFEPVYDVVEVRCVSFVGDCLGFKNKDATQWELNAGYWDVPFGKNTDLPYDKKAFTGAEFYSLLASEDWQQKFVTSKGLTSVIYVSCSYEQVREFEDVLKSNADNLRHVIDYQVCPWIKTQKGGGLYLGNTGSNLCRNVEWGLRICLGPKRKHGDEVKKLVDAHFPFLTTSDDKKEIEIMNKLRTQAFFCPHITDYEKYKDPDVNGKSLNVYEKGMFFSDMIINNISKPGDWVFIPFSGSASVVEGALLNQRNVVMVEKDLNQYDASDHRLNIEFIAKLKLIVKPFDFEKVLMLCHKADHEKPECDRRYMIPPFTVSFKEPQAEAEKPWLWIKKYNAEQNGLLRKCKWCWKQTEHLRFSFLAKWYVRALAGYGEQPEEGQSKVDQFFEKGTKKKRQVEESSSSAEKPVKKGKMGNDEGGADGKGEVLGEKKYIWDVVYKMQGMSKELIGVAADPVDNSLLSDVEYLVAESWALLPLESKQLFADASRILFMKIAGKWFYADPLSFGMIGAMQSVFIRSKVIENRETLLGPKDIGFKPICVCRVAVDVEAAITIERAVERVRSNDSNYSFISDGAFFTTQTRLIYLPLESYASVEKPSPSEILKPFPDEVRNRYEEPYLFDFDDDAVNLMNIETSKRELPFYSVAVIEADREFNKVCGLCKLFKLVGKGEDEVKERWKDVFGDIERLELVNLLKDFNSVVKYTGSCEYFYSVELPTILSDIHFSKFDTFSDHIPDSLYDENAGKDINLLFEPSVNSQRVFQRKLKSFALSRERLDEDFISRLVDEFSDMGKDIDEGEYLLRFKRFLDEKKREREIAENEARMNVSDSSSNSESESLQSSQSEKAMDSDSTKKYVKGSKKKGGKKKNRK